MTGHEPPPDAATGDYDETGVPSFNYVRDKIEGRLTTSAGATELAQETPDAADLDKKMADRDKAGTDRLEAIRRAMRGDQPPSDD